MTLVLCAAFVLMTTGCKKKTVSESGDGGSSSTTTTTKYFIDVDFLPETETNGELQPRLMANFNDEMVYIELRPTAGIPFESMLFLGQDNESMMVCGNDSMMIMTAYDMEVHQPADNVIVVTRMNDETLLLTKCVMNWNNNSMTKGDQMILPIEASLKNNRIKYDKDIDIRVYFMEEFMKPLIANIERAESFCGVWGIRAGAIFATFRYILSSAAPILLFSDDPELLLKYSEYPITAGTVQLAQKGILRFFPKKLREMAARILAGIGWFTAGGHSTVNGSTSTHEPPMESFFNKGRRMKQAVVEMGTLDPAFIIGFNVSNITEHSAYFKGSFQFGVNHITPVEMGYVFKLSGGPDNIVSDMNYNGTTVTGLQKATKYTAYAYAKSLLETPVSSPEITFWTLGFEAFPTALDFPATGGAKEVGLSYPDDDITGWNITSKPSWCTVNKTGAKMFSVKVGKATEARSGTITVTAQSKALGSITQSVEVSQQGSNAWNGTNWRFSGTLTYTAQGVTQSQPYECTLQVNSVANQDVVFSFAQEGQATFGNSYSDNYVVNSNGNLVYTATGVMSASGFSFNATSKVIFVRTGSNTATASFQLQETMSGYGITSSATGTLQGTLIRND